MREIIIRIVMWGEDDDLLNSDKGATTTTTAENKNSNNNWAQWSDPRQQRQITRWTRHTETTRRRRRRYLGSGTIINPVMWTQRRYIHTEDRLRIGPNDDGEEMIGHYLSIDQSYFLSRLTAAAVVVPLLGLPHRIYLISYIVFPLWPFDEVKWESAE